MYHRAASPARITTLFSYLAARSKVFHGTRSLLIAGGKRRPCDSLVILRSRKDLWSQRTAKMSKENIQFWAIITNLKRQLRFKVKSLCPQLRPTSSGMPWWKGVVTISLLPAGADIPVATGRRQGRWEAMRVLGELVLMLSCKGLHLAAPGSINSSRSSWRTAEVMSTQASPHAIGPLSRLHSASHCQRSLLTERRPQPLTSSGVVRAQPPCLSC